MDQAKYATAMDIITRTSPTLAEDHRRRQAVMNAPDPEAAMDAIIASQPKPNSTFKPTLAQGSDQWPKKI